MKKNLQLSILLLLFLSANFIYAQNGTANGTYHFGNLGTVNSGGTGFKKQGDKFKISNDYVDDGANGLYDGYANHNISDQSTLIIKAEGGSVCKTFTLKDIALYTYAGSVEISRAYSMFTVALFNVSGGSIATHTISSNVDIGKNAILKLKDIPFTSAWPSAGYSNVAEIRITFAAVGSKPEILGFSNITIENVYAGTLSVNLLSYELKKEGAAVKLQWKTASEKDNKGFIVYRSGDDKRFVKLFEVEGNGTTSENKSYSFTDKSPLIGNNYYKLVQLDFNGEVTELGEKTVDFNFLASVVSASPNPAHDKLNIRFESGKYHSLILSSIEGKVLQKINPRPREGNLELDLTCYSKGIYFVKLVGNGNNIIHKVIKQ